MPGAGPDEVLVRPGQNLDRLNRGGVPGEQAMVVPVGAHQIGQQFGVPSIGLRPGNLVAVAVAGHCERVDRIYLVAVQRLDPQAAVGFDADHHLGRCVGVGGHKLVEPADAGESFGQSPRRQPGPVGVHQVNVVVVFGPVVPNEYRQLSSLLGVVKPVRAERHPAAT